LGLSHHRANEAHQRRTCLVFSCAVPMGGALPQTDGAAEGVEEAAGTGVPPGEFAMRQPRKGDVSFLKCPLTAAIHHHHLERLQSRLIVSAKCFPSSFRDCPPEQFHRLSFNVYQTNHQPLTTNHQPRSPPPPLSLSLTHTHAHTLSLALSICLKSAGIPVLFHLCTGSPPLP
jgi:hypothetical protein